MRVARETFKPIEGFLYRIARRSGRSRYIYTAIFFGIALSLQLLVNQRYPGVPFLFLYPTIFFTGWLFGLGAGFLCLALAVGGNFLIWHLDVLGSVKPQILHLRPLSVFALLTSSILALIEASRNALFRSQDALQEARDFESRLKNAIGMRDEFLSIASHELKTPLTPLKLQIQLLLRLLDRPGLFVSDAGRDQVRGGILQALRSTDRLAGLIENLLDVTRINSGHLALSVETTDVSRLVLDVTSRFLPQFQQAAQRLQVQVPPGVTGVVDRIRFEQILTNLLTNAIKYGRGLPVTVRLSTSDSILTLEVVDQGIGIREEEKSRIFECYERAISEKSIGGLGLGLYIARQYAAAHHGKISVKSKLGEGSTFTVSLPIDARRTTAIWSQTGNENDLSH